MNYEERDTYGMYKAAGTKGGRSATGHGPGPRLMGADTLIGNEVCNRKHESLGGVKEIMLNMHDGRVRYLVPSFGGFPGRGEKLFAVPWDALQLDTLHKRFQLDVNKDRLSGAPGFNKDEWPDMADPAWEKNIHAYHGTKPRLTIEHA